MEDSRSLFDFENIRPEEESASSNTQNEEEKVRPS